MKITITEILESSENEDTAASIYSHEGMREYQRCLEAERVEKIDEGRWPGLPFTCTAEDVDEAIEKYNEKFCAFPNILQAEDVDWEEAGD